ncbi:MAG: DNA methyltransferase [archaeon]|jgi:hypothetical protein
MDLILAAKIETALGKLSGQSSIYDLFALLGYPKGILLQTNSKRKKSSFDLRKDDEKRINEIYSILSFEDKLPVFLIECTTLQNSFIKTVTATFDKQYTQFMLIFSQEYNQLVFVLPKKEKVSEGEQKLKITKLNIDKNNIYYTDKEILTSIIYEKDGHWREIWKKWLNAFNVEKVTGAFFEDYKKAFFGIRKQISSQQIQSKDAHEFTLQFLNRIMFIYFIQRKKWLKQEKFMKWYFDQYKMNEQFASNNFYENWLKQLFFKALNNNSGEIVELPKEVIDTMHEFPYLNGGLFRENKLDRLKIVVTDQMFKTVLEFFEKYNFTIKEDMPLEEEVAVDPQMIGYVYESLANVADEIYDRNDLGIFYTPRIEVDFMCRRTIVEYLSKNNPELSKDDLYHFVFDPHEQKEKIKYFTEKNWEKIEEDLDNVSVVDPACGSGAFLVGMLNVLSELYKVDYKHIGRNEITDFDLKFGIVQRSLYGVDVMPWAIHAAELRIWLQLIVETEFKKEKLREHPLLPNLNLNLRIGDSLVQEIGGLSFNVRTNNLKPSLKKKLDLLKQEKRKYFENSPTAKFKDPENIKREESKLFSEIIEERISHLELKMKKNEPFAKTKQAGLFGEVKEQSKDIKKLNEEASNAQKIVEESYKETLLLKKIRASLTDPEKKPFIWDIDFAEIFGDKDGFDIVIGNPPYVRQEMISPPNKTKIEVKQEDRKEYKEKLVASIKNRFDEINDINRQSDLYLYFYFHGLSLLNQKGTFCFITSNSWLDVGYGAELQEFLCKFVPILGIYDNPKRSFAHADVNTIIALFGAPILNDELNQLKTTGPKSWLMLQNTAKFIMFKKPFEEVINTKILIEIEKAQAIITTQPLTGLVKNIHKTPSYRLFPILQADLLDDAWEYPEEYDFSKGRFKEGKYVGNKWGSKYLRAPDIFFSILEKGNEKLTIFSKLTELTQRNTLQNFDSIVELKENYLVNSNYPYLSSVKQVDKIKISPAELPMSIKQTTKNPKEFLVPDIISNRFLGDRLFFIEGGKFLVGDTFFVAKLKKEFDKQLVSALLNSTISLLFTEILGRKNLGGGLLTIYGPEFRGLILLNPSVISKTRISSILKNYDLLSKRKIESIFGECGLDGSKSISDQVPNPKQDRSKLDELIFDELGLTKEERLEVYLALCVLVKQRSDKAKSVDD